MKVWGCIIKNIFSSLFFNFSITWKIDCDIDLFKRIMNNSLEKNDNKLFSEKPFRGEHIEYQGIYKISHFNSFFNSIYFNSNTKISYQESEPVVVNLSVVDYGYLLLIIFIGAIPLFYHNIVLKNILAALFLGYLLSIIIFGFEILMKYSMVHDVLLKTKSKVKRLNRCKSLDTRRIIN